MNFNRFVISSFLLAGCGPAPVQSIPRVPAPEVRAKDQLAPTEFRMIKSKLCGDRVLSLVPGERVIADLETGVFGLGHTEQNCNIVDFKSVVIQAKGPDSTVVIPNKSIGRRSSCWARNVLAPYAGLEFTLAVIGKDWIELRGVPGECPNILLQF